jgi:hypothetical protein
LVARESVELVSGDDKNAARVLADLAKVGVKRILPAWLSADPPAYPKSIGSTKLKMPAWDDDAEDRKKAAALYKEPATDLEALREIIRALPIPVGDMRWRT